MKKRITKRNYKPINLVVVHENEVFRLGFKTLFDKNTEFRVTGEASTLEGAVNCIKRYRPLVVLMDIRLTNGYPLGGCMEVLAISPETRLVFLVNPEDQNHVLTAIRSGAQGILHKGISARALARAINTVVAGHSFVDPKVTAQVFALIKNLPGPQEIPGLSSLSSQERQVLDLVARCQTNKEIATTLGLSVKTIQNYLANIFEKLNVTRRCQIAVLFANRPIPDRLKGEKNETCSSRE